MGIFLLQPIWHYMTTSLSILSSRLKKNTHFCVSWWEKHHFDSASRSSFLTTETALRVGLSVRDSFEYFKGVHSKIRINSCNVFTHKFIYYSVSADCLELQIIVSNYRLIQYTFSAGFHEKPKHLSGGCLGPLLCLSVKWLQLKVILLCRKHKKLERKAPYNLCKVMHSLLVFSYL